MEKTVEIGGRQVTFKFSAAAFYIFKSQFGYDVMQKLLPVIGEAITSLDLSVDLKDGQVGKAGKKKEEEINLAELVGPLLEDIASFELTEILNLLWAFAKCGDKKIPSPEKWYLGFEDFPLFDVIGEIWPSMVESLGTKKKLKATKNQTEETQETK